METTGLTKEETKTLERLIGSFYENDTKEKQYKSLSEAEKIKIKGIMTEHNLPSYDVEINNVGNLHVTCSTSIKETLNEEDLAYVLLDNGFKDCTKMVRVVDMDALEKALYNNRIPKEVIKKINKCKTTKETITLKCKVK